MNWLAAHIGTIAVSLALSALLAGIIIRLVRDKRAGKSSCGCNCAHCSMAGQCHKKS